MNKIIILENNYDSNFSHTIDMAKIYEDKMNGETLLDEGTHEYIVLPMMHRFSMKTIELDKNGLDIYIKKLEDIKEQLEK